MAESPQGAATMAPRHEERDVQARPIVLFGVSLLGLALVSLLIGGWVLEVFTAQGVVGPDFIAAPPDSGQFPEPHLQDAPIAEMQHLRSEAEARLSSYGWVNRPAGVVRMPLDRAMDLLVQRGLPAPSTPSATPHEEQP